MKRQKGSGEVKCQTQSAGIAQLHFQTLLLTYSFWWRIAHTHLREAYALFAKDFDEARSLFRIQTECEFVLLLTNLLRAQQVTIDRHTQLLRLMLEGLACVFIPFIQPTRLN